MYLRKIAKRRLLAIWYLSVRPSAWNNSAPTGSNFVKFFLYLSTGKVTPLEARLWPMGGRGGGIALLFQDLGARRGWGFSSTPWPHFTPGKDPVPIVKEAGWAPGLVWTGGKSRPTGIRSPDRPTRSSVSLPPELPGPLWYLGVFLKISRENSCFITT
jgi:hypothetical protein